MKLYTTSVAPNPRRVSIFLAEKGIEVPQVEIDLAGNEHLLPEFLERNPLGRVPVLEFEDGSYLAESVAICRYFEVTDPEPALFGTGARAQAEVEMWNRRMEFEILANVSGSFRHSHPYWAERIEQVPDFGDLCRRTLMDRMKWLDEELAGRSFIAGERFTIADITAICAFDLAKVAKVRIPEELGRLTEWYGTVSGRPSVASTRPGRKE